MSNGAGNRRRASGPSCVPTPRKKLMRHWPSSTGPGATQQRHGALRRLLRAGPQWPALPGSVELPPTATDKQRRFHSEEANSVHFNVVRKQRSSNLVLVEASDSARRSSLRWFSGIGWATSVQALDYEYDGIEYAGLPVVFLRYHIVPQMNSVQQCYR